MSGHTESAAPETAAGGAAPGRTVLETAFASSPLRLLTPANHGDAAWVFLASLGGGLLDGDHLDVTVDVGDGASALLGTQASTKVYRTRPGEPGETDASSGRSDSGSRAAGSSQRLSARVGASAVLTLVPDPVVCFAEARYEQTIDVALDPSASLLLLDGYSCGRSARGERWAFARYASKTTVVRDGVRSIVDATRLDPRHGALAERMGRFDIVLSLLAVGPRFHQVREAMLAASSPVGSDAVLVAASPLGDDACLLRVAAERFEPASHVLRSSFISLATLLGDDPFARKW